MKAITTTKYIKKGASVSEVADRVMKVHEDCLREFGQIAFVSVVVIPQEYGNVVAVTGVGDDLL